MTGKPMVFRALMVLLVLLARHNVGFAQIDAPNIGFEKGTFENWTCYMGRIDTAGNIYAYPGEPDPYMFHIVKRLGTKDVSPQVDQYGGFPIISPNGSKYSVILGNSDRVNSVQRLAYTLNVPATGSNSIIFDYAIVLLNPTHPAHEYYQQPRFTLRVYNVTDDKYLDCPTFDFVSSGTLPGFKRLGDLVYKDWSTATIDLKGYNNKTIRLEFTVNHCPFVEHFGYAYLDIQENISSPISGNAYCKGARAVTLTAPQGFSSYTWYNADFSKMLGNGQTLNISPAPADLTKYALQVTPYDGLGCADTLYTVVNKIDNDFNLNVRERINACPGTIADLTDPLVTKGSSNMSFTYFRDSLAYEPLYYPEAVTEAGKYYIKGTSPEGCTNILPVTVTFDKPNLQATDPLPVTYPETVDLSKTFVPQEGINYTYYKDKETLLPLQNFAQVDRSGTFYINGMDEFGCGITVPVNVVIDPPAYSVTAVNTFTPNGDGINDKFMVDLEGYVTFRSLKIYNRNGQLVYETTSAGKPWNGARNGAEMPAGTYYWVFDGVYDYNQKVVTKGASITLLR